MKHLLFGLIVFYLFSCRDESKRIEKLEQENKNLKSLNELLCKRINNTMYSPIVYPLSNHIKLGEKYEALFYTCVKHDSLFPTVYVNSYESRNLVEKLKYNPELGGDYFSVTPQRKGEHKYFARVVVPKIDKTDTVYVKWSFTVE